MSTWCGQEETTYCTRECVHTTMQQELFVDASMRPLYSRHDTITCVHAHTRTRIRTHTHTHTHITHTHTHTHHARACAHTHTHTHTNRSTFTGLGPPFSPAGPKPWQIDSSWLGESDKSNGLHFILTESLVFVCFFVCLFAIIIITTIDITTTAITIIDINHELP
jgi:hypothetical protein